MEVETSGMLRSDEDERRRLGVREPALVTLPEATGPELEEELEAAPDWE